MTCWFFMSYARADDQHREAGYVRTFYDDLKAEVASKVKDQSPPIGFLDQENLKPGDPWPDKIAEALRICRTFVPIMTARYFTRVYCGIEWKIFENRCKNTEGKNKVQPLIIPVLWDKPEEDEFPDYALDLQITFDPNTVLDSEKEMLADYGKYGLLHVIKRKETSHRNTYETIVEKLARHTIRVAKQYELPSLDSHNLPALKEENSRFHENTDGRDAKSVVVSPSSRAHFAFVAGRRSEMKGVRENPHQYYGIEGAGEWMPYAPRRADPIALIAQTAATENRLVCEWVMVDQQFVDRLRQAEEHYSVAIIIVDPWSARLPQYEGILSEFDRYQFKNCVVIVAWNPHDQQTQVQRNKLEEVVRRVLFRRFTTSFVAKNNIFFKHKIEDYSQLKAEIAKSLNEIESLLAPDREPLRPIGESERNESPSISASRGTT